MTRTKSSSRGSSPFYELFSVLFLLGAIITLIVAVYHFITALLPGGSMLNSIIMSVVYFIVAIVLFYFYGRFRDY